MLFILPGWPFVVAVPDRTGREAEDEVAYILVVFFFCGGECEEGG